LSIQICKSDAVPLRLISLKPVIGPGFPLPPPILLAVEAVAVLAPVVVPAVDNSPCSEKSPCVAYGTGAFFMDIQKIIPVNAKILTRQV
jgi:hypothetical protein